MKVHSTSLPQAPDKQTPQVNDLSALLEKLQATESGLSTEEAQRRLVQYGANEPAPARRFATIQQFLSFLLNPLVMILLVASLISAVLGERLNAAIIVLMVMLSVVINFVQTYRSQQAADRLRAQVAPTATVLRDGAWSELHAAISYLAISSGSPRVTSCPLMRD